LLTEPVTVDFGVGATVVVDAAALREAEALAFALELAGTEPDGTGAAYADASTAVTSTGAGDLPAMTPNAVPAARTT
jgi:hypothetical protein